MSDYQLEVLVSERKAILDSYNASALEQDRTLVRRWEKISNKFLEDVESDLRARRKETNPIADQKTYTGTWRIVNVRAVRGESDTRGGTIFENLAFGFQTALTESEARMVSVDGEPQNAGFRITRAWVYVDPDAADDLITTLSGVTTVSNPQADGETYTGTFAAGRAVASGNEDGSVTITQVLSKVSTVGDFADLYALTPADTRRTTEEVHPFDEAGDFEVYTVNQRIDREIQKFTNLYAENQDAIDAFTPAQLTAFAPSGYAFLSKDLREEEDGTLTLEVTFQDITAKDIYLANTTQESDLTTVSRELYLEQADDTPLSTTADAVQGNIVSTRVSRREDGRFDKEKEVRTSVEHTTRFQSQSSLFRTEDSILYENSRDHIVAPDADGTGIYTVRQRQNEDGTYSGSLVYEQGSSQGEVKWNSQNSTLVEGDSILYKDWDSPIQAPDDGLYGVYSVTNSLTERGTYDARLVYEKSIPKTVLFKDSSTQFRTGSSILYENYGEKINSPDADGSGIYRVSQRLNQDGTYSGQLTYEQGLNAGEAEFAATNSALSNDNEVLYRSRTTQVDAPSSVQAAVYQVSNNLNEDGLYDARLIYQESKAGQIEFGSSVSRFRKGNAVVYENSRSLIEAPTTVAGSGVYNVNQSINEDGTYSGRLVYEEGLNSGEAVFESRNSTLSDDKEIIYRSRTSQVDAPGSAQGAVYDVTNTLGDDGLYDARLVYSESIADSARYKSTSTRFIDGTTILYENSRSAIVAPDATGSGVYRVAQRFNEDGTYSGTLVYEQGSDQGEAQWASSEATLRNSDTVIYRDRSTQVDSPLSGQGAIYSATNSLTDRGTYDARLVYDVSVAKTAEFKNRSTQFISGSSIIYENSRLVIEAPDATGSGLYSVSQRMNDDGTYSGTLIYQDGTNTGEAAFESRNSNLSDDNTIIYRSRTTQIDAPTGGQGGVYDVSNTLTDEGLYNAQLVYSVSVADSIAFKSGSGPISTEQAIVYENSREAIVAPDADTGVYRVSNRINEDGTFSGTLVYSLPSGEAVGAFSSERSELQNQDSVLYRDQASILNAGTSNPGGIYSAINSLNDRGLYDSRLVYQLSAAKTAEFAQNRTPFVTANAIIYENSLSVITAPDVDLGLYSVSQRMNQDGSYSGQLVYNQTTGSGEVRVDSQNGLTREEVDVIYKSTGAAVPAQTGVQGAIYNASNTLRDDGLYDARLVYTKSKALSVDFSSVEGPLEVSESIVYENSFTPLDPPSGVDGLYRVNQGLNADGTYSGSVVYSKGVPFSTAQNWSNNNRAVTLYMYRNQEDVTIPEASVYNRNSLTGLQYNNDGTYDFNFITENDDTVNGTTPLASGYTNAVYLYSIRDRKYYQFNKAWTHSREEAHDFAEGTSALLYGTKLSGKTVVGFLDGKVTDFGPRNGMWNATRIEVY